MGYVVKKSNYKKRSWRVQYETRVGLRKSRDIPESDYLSLGLHVGLDIEDVKRICKSLNTLNRIRTIEEKRGLIKQRLAIEDAMVNLSLPAILLKEFEDTQIIPSQNKQYIHWRAAKRIISTTELDIIHWAYNKNFFYSAFNKNRYSLDYCRKILYILNKWGKFVAYKRQCFYENIPFPSSNIREKLVDQHEAFKGSTKSENMLPALLEAKKSELSTQCYNWIYLSLWLGLRPLEVDLLLKPSSPSTWFLDGNVLWVYQSKLVNIPRQERFKPIPLKYDEQVECLRIIKEKNFKRPLNKTMKRVFRGQYTCYAGRKGFTDLLLSRGVSIEAIAQYMGHTSIEMTWKSYKSRKKVIL